MKLKDEIFDMTIEEIAKKSMECKHEMTVAEAILFHTNFCKTLSETLKPSNLACTMNDKDFKSLINTFSISFAASLLSYVKNKEEFERQTQNIYKA